MKKIFMCISIIISMLLIFTGCGTSKDVVEVMSAIDAIGNVTIDSVSAIDAAEAAYNDLSENKRSSVINYGALVYARNEYDILNVKNAIATIGDVTIDSGVAIESAETAYKALSTTQRHSVDNYKKLQEAKKKYTFIKVGTTVCQGCEYFVFSEQDMTIEKVGEPNPLNDYGNYDTLYEAVKNNIIYIYEELGISDSIIKKIGNTTMMDGTQTEVVDNICVTWSFDPTRANCLYLLFKYNPVQ